MRRRLDTLAVSLFAACYLAMLLSLASCTTPQAGDAYGGNTNDMTDADGQVVAPPDYVQPEAWP